MAVFEKISLCGVIDLVNQLNNAVDEGKPVRLDLGEGKLLVAIPENEFKNLHAIFNDPEFIEGLKEGLDDFRNDNGTALSELEEFQDDNEG